MTTTNILLIDLVALMAVFTVVWAASLKTRDASLVDRYWGAAFALSAALAFALVPERQARDWLIAGMTLVWGARLSIHITVRNWGHGEDRRYAKMRERGGPGWDKRSLVTVFWLQAGLAFVIGLPMVLGQTLPASPGLGALELIGLGVFLVGFAFEAVGDYQLSRFKADPTNEGKVMDQGLWRYTRHPNYFGDAVVHWGIFIAACGTPGVAWAFAGPALMTFMLVRVSGVALLEKDLKKRRPEYRAYIERTSAFIPMPPKSSPGQAATSDGPA